MSKHRVPRAALFASSLLVMLLFVVPGCAQTSASRITTDELREMLTERQPVVLDVRDRRSWEDSDQKIMGAVRLDPSNADLANLPIAKNALLVLY